MTTPLRTSAPASTRTLRLFALDALRRLDDVTMRARARAIDAQYLVYYDWFQHYVTAAEALGTVPHQQMRSCRPRDVLPGDAAWRDFVRAEYRARGLLLGWLSCTSSLCPLRAHNLNFLA